METSDGGNNWEIQKKMTPPIIIKGSFFIDLSTGWMVGGEGEDTAGGFVVQRSIILHTNNGGRTWEVQYKKQTKLELFDVYFVDPSTGWVVGEKGTILHTRDGGGTWKPQKSKTGLDLIKIHFADNKRGWAIGRGYVWEWDITWGIILYTEDGGERWQVQWKGKNEWLYGMSFVENNSLSDTTLVIVR